MYDLLGPHICGVRKLTLHHLFPSSIRAVLRNGGSPLVTAKIRDLVSFFATTHLALKGMTVFGIFIINDINTSDINFVRKHLKFLLDYVSPTNIYKRLKQRELFSHSVHIWTYLKSSYVFLPVKWPVLSPIQTLSQLHTVLAQIASAGQFPSGLVQSVVDPSTFTVTGPEMINTTIDLSHVSFP